LPLTQPQPRAYVRHPVTLQPRQGFGLAGKGQRYPLPSIAEILASWIYKRTNQGSAGSVTVVLDDTASNSIF